ncbi:MAG TPA: hypothetical protein DHW10_02855 [Rhodospirillaceae bacterium]|nr:hypothetical protein [Rhodospirillaceae bacterium]|tara:strand:- start:400 stop:723 length:324 start_codon:yes stop_codon:yes gene_type:complete
MIKMPIKFNPLMSAFSLVAVGAVTYTTGVKDFADLAIVTASTIGAGFISAVISMNLALAAVKSHAKKHNNLMLHERQRLKNIGMLSIPICTAAGATAGNILTRGLVL